MLQALMSHERSMTNLLKSNTNTTKTTKETKIGGHLSAAGGYANALDRAIAIGANCLQLFSSSPRIWGITPVSDEQTNHFTKKKHELAIDPIYFHASYLVNFADSDRIGKASIHTLIQELQLAKKMEILGSIIHLGSFKQQEQPTAQQYNILFSNIQEVLDQTPEDTFFIIENAGNKKLCWSLDELGFIVRELNSPRVRVCLDTCHLWGAGFDLSTPEKFDAYFLEFDKKVGLDKLEVFQVNDSKDARGSFRDRHENIGEGNIPREEFRLLLNDDKTKDIPFILEVPGEDKKGPDKYNVDVLKSLITR
jgi:deoxyribonuclease-4